MKRLVLLISMFLLAIMTVSANPVINVVGAQTVAEGATLTFEVTSTAADNVTTAFTYNYTGTYGSLTKNNETSATFTWTPGFTDAGVYNFEFTATDLDSTTSTTPVITVTNTNRAPIISTSAVTSVVKDHAYSYDVDATDADSDVLGYSLVSPPAGMTINATSGLIVWTPTTVGNYSVKVRATDASLYDQQNFTVEVLSPTYSLSLTDVTVGGTTQERDNTETATFTVTNIGSETITSITLSDNADTSYGVNFTPSTIASLAASASVTVTVSLYIPEDQDAGELNIATITAVGTSGTNQVTGTSDLNVEAENNLVIKDGTITVDGDDQNLDDGDDVTVRPGADVILELDIKNTFGDSIDIEDIEILVYDDSGDLDIDEEESMSKLRRRDTETVIFEFTIDKDSDESTYEVFIEVTGVDENDAEHGETWVIDFDVEKKTHDIRIAKANLGSYFCGDNSVELSIELENIGTKDEDEVAIEIKSTVLDYHRIFYDLVIDEEDDLTKEVIIPIPSDVDAGTIIIDLTAYYDRDEETDIDYVYLTIPSSCGTTVPSTDNNGNANQDNSGSIVVESGNNNPVVDDTNFVSSSSGQEVTSGLFGGGALATSLLVMANLLVLVIIVILVMKFLVRV